MDPTDHFVAIVATAPRGRWPMKRENETVLAVFSVSPNRLGAFSGLALRSTVWTFRVSSLPSH